MRLALIAAVADNGVIGQAGSVPWRLPEDLKTFKRLTLGHAVLMGRRTFESIQTRLGGPLPGRRNLVLTRQRGLRVPLGVEVFQDLDLALEAAGRGLVFCIGGGELYRQTIDRADRLYISHVHQSPPGDVTFPPIDPAVWGETERTPSSGFTLVVYERPPADRPPPSAPKDG